MYTIANEHTAIANDAAPIIASGTWIISRSNDASWIKRVDRADLPAPGYPWITITSAISLINYKYLKKSILPYR